MFLDVDYCHHLKVRALHVFPLDRTSNQDVSWHEFLDSKVLNQSLENKA